AIFFFFSSRRRHTRFSRDWSSDVCSSDLTEQTSPTPTEEPEKPKNSFFGDVVDNIDIQPAEEAIPDPPRLHEMLEDARKKPAERSEERRVGKEWRSRREQQQVTKERWWRT